MAANAARSRPDAPRLLSIGQVLARLSKDFPELTSSKLRFLEEQGLVTPSRTPSGYRKFSPRDVDRLRLILSMQRDHYLPLKVIRHHLAEIDAGGTPSIPALDGSSSTIIPGGRRYKRDDAIREAGASPALWNEAVSASLLTPAETYGEETVALLSALVILAKHGIEPRHLRAVRAGVERETGLVESALLPLRRRSDAASRAAAAEAAGDISAQIGIVRATLMRAALGRLTSGA